MPGLVPGIHVPAAAKNVDGRDKPGHDVAGAAAPCSWRALLHIDLLPDRRQRFCNISITLQCGIMKGVSCRRGAFARG
ncbi:hypothetical protein XH96_19245 [Bradyrhizobium sp. CCBAU 51765]|nr:hypothetical protein XH96_19245 [Bradyrhizobium sp. CCBAU 51765]